MEDSARVTMGGWSAMALVVAVIAVAGALLPPTASRPLPSGVSISVDRVGWINVSATGNHGFTPTDFQQLPTDASMTVRFTDQTDLAQTFTIIGKEGWVVPGTYTPAQIENLAYGGSPPALVNSNVSGVGDVGVATFESPGPGWYEFVSTEPGLFQLGMFGFVAFGMNLPSNLTSPSKNATGRVGSISIAATGNYGYTPADLQNVPDNATITVTFTDESDMAHTFTIIGKEGWEIPSTYTPAQIDSLAYGDSPPALENANVSGPGDVNVTTFESPATGWYEFVCTVSGHFQLGMYGFIAFNMTLPSNLTRSNRTGLGGGLSFSPLDAGIITVLLVVCVAGYFLLRRRRERERMGP